MGPALLSHDYSSTKGDSHEIVFRYRQCQRNSRSGQLWPRRWYHDQSLARLEEGRDFKDLLLEICSLVDGPISAEVVSVEAEAMVKEGRELAKIHKNIVVKVPLIPEGLKATKHMASEGIRVNVTLCFSPT